MQNTCRHFFFPRQHKLSANPAQAERDSELELLLLQVLLPSLLLSSLEELLASLAGFLGRGRALALLRAAAAGAKVLLLLLPPFGSSVAAV